ncbi:hypothetical protein BAUCODRAFT_29986 [Baudoinia panamericana UAMH 10762]|uniref:mRNA N(6)-methyladenine demethylase n=1 Tax=Baudoinia panamericana (strain UAMH 10762) TaxID=717646 RepID=M2LY35_BAUPA|nr:uncharacterized protein BAUCODRAFT_29986 [Baudoinia panamericana UAMH 10762]EMC99612.1 hypothetical protein BAUCODRAFT_29986 [Baudoinia panamericana UAMH 10762]
MPGLFVYPTFLPPPVQAEVLNKLLHRDLSVPSHQTNVHLHYDISYSPELISREGDASFFGPSASDLNHNSKTTPSSISTAQLLNKKLRWITLGGQYDWSNKVYPPGAPPSFPADIKKLVEDAFPMKAEAAIVNIYSPGDTLSVHRDVSEACAQPLVSISLGCDAIFFVAVEEVTATTSPPCADGQAQPISAEYQSHTAAIRLRSGDAVLMSGTSRYAWHGVPKVLADTCPECLRDWPAIGSEAENETYAAFRGWLKGKRVNLNVRQIFASD